MDIEIKKVEADVLDHIGIASEVIDKLDLVRIIDSFIPKRSSHFKITHGEAVKAIILSGLGFSDRRMYKVATFLKHKAVDKIFRPGIKWSDFTDDVLLSTLDKINQYGVSNFLFDIVGKIFLKHRFLFSYLANLDTTTLSLRGKFKNKNFKVRPKFGHSKDKRPDLLQMVLSLGITGPAKVPFWMDVHSGNKSDKDSLISAMKRMYVKRTPPQIFHLFL